MKDLTWYALTVPPQKEFAAEQILRRVGFAAFAPVEEKFPRHRRGSRARDKTAKPKRYPFFVRYVFAGFNLAEHEGEIPLYRLSKLNIIKGVVGSGGRPLPLPEEAVDQLIALSGKQIPWRSSPNPHKSFRKGDYAEINSGAFAGYTLPIEEVSGEFAIFIKQFFGKECKVKVPLRYLEAA